MREQHHRHAGRERFHDGAMSAVRDHGGRVSQHLTMRCVRKNGDIGRGVQRCGVDRGAGRNEAVDWKSAQRLNDTPQRTDLILER